MDIQTAITVALRRFLEVILTALIGAKSGVRC